MTFKMIQPALLAMGLHFGIGNFKAPQNSANPLQNEVPTLTAKPDAQLDFDSVNTIETLQTPSSQIVKTDLLPKKSHLTIWNTNLSLQVLSHLIAPAHAQDSGNANAAENDPFLQMVQNMNEEQAAEFVDAVLDNDEKPSSWKTSLFSVLNYLNANRIYGLPLLALALIFRTVRKRKVQPNQQQIEFLRQELQEADRICKEDETDLTIKNSEAWHPRLVKKDGTIDWETVPEVIAAYVQEGVVENDEDNEDGVTDGTSATDNIEEPVTSEQPLIEDVEIEGWRLSDEEIDEIVSSILPTSSDTTDTTELELTTNEADKTDDESSPTGIPRLRLVSDNLDLGEGEGDENLRDVLAADEGDDSFLDGVVRLINSSDNLAANVGATESAEDLPDLDALNDTEGEPNLDDLEGDDTDGLPDLGKLSGQENKGLPDSDELPELDEDKDTWPSLVNLPDQLPEKEADDDVLPELDLE